ncbi:MAG: non-canonical purine NTP pyrophosphatase [Proteobacteria bacterium]|nr:non-canonical purine NTP pyrophosphatase [Pseudomonadota bacterium]
MSTSSIEKGFMNINSLLVVTGNKGKAEEFKELLSIESLRVEHKSLPLQEIQSLDIYKIGRSKTEAAFSFTQDIQGFDAILTDDTSLDCEALKGLPGPLIKWFLQALGPLGILELIEGKSRKAEAICLLTLGIRTSGRIYQFEGNVPGEMVPPRGESGFGWDPVFQPDGSNKTYAEFSLKEKSGFSHRSIAVAQLRDWILAQNN